MTWAGVFWLTGIVVTLALRAYFDDGPGSKLWRDGLAERRERWN